MAAYELSPAELTLLVHTGRTVDELDRLDRVTRKAEPMVTGSKGQPVVMAMAQPWKWRCRRGHRLRYDADEARRRLNRGAVVYLDAE